MIKFLHPPTGLIEIEISCDVSGCASSARFTGATYSIARQAALADGWLVSVAVREKPTVIGEKCLTCQTEAA